MTVSTLHAEQLVYGTFPFTQGFTLVARSSGLDPALAQAAVQACRSWGEVGRPEFRSALWHLALPAPHEAHLVSKVIRQGTDPGARMAWYHQVLILNEADYLAAGADCFAFDKAGFFKDRWFENDDCQPIDVDAALVPALDAGSLSDSAQVPARAIAAALEQGREVRLQAGRPCRAIDEVCRTALALLAPERRAAVALASFAYRPVRRYDLWCVHEPGGDCPESADQVQPRTR